MAWDEAVFGWVANRVRSWRERPDAERLRKECLAEPLLPRLRVIAAAVAGHELAVALAPDEGGAGGGVVLLPIALTVAESPLRNERLFVLRAALGGAVVRAGLAATDDGDAELLAAIGSVEAGLRDELPGWGEERDAVAESLLAGRPAIAALPARAAVLEAVVRARLGADPLQLRGELAPQWRAAFDDLLAGDPAVAALRGVRAAPVALWGRLLRPSATAPIARRGEDAGEQPRTGATERRGRPRRPPKRAALDTREEQENPLTHSFEKVHTAEDYQGGSKRADGADELDAQHAALEELDLDTVVVSSTPTHSVYRADALFLSGGEDGGAARGTLAYDEWDGVRRRYLSRYCRLSVVGPPSNAAAGAALWARVMREQRRATEHLRREMLRLETALRWRTRQPDGPEVDIDSVVEREASLAAGHEGPDRLYVSRRRRGHELAVLLLLDASMSTDGWVRDRRVLDTERDAAVVIAAALEGWVNEIGVAAFMSFSHDDCRFVAVKGFDEPWTAGLARLASVEPAGYTRIGPALRHGTERLGRCAAKRKLLLLLTDGKPTDTDRYEGRHGEGDVRQAIREARRVGVDVFAFAVDPRARKQLPAMFGHQNFAGLESPEKLASAATELCARLRA